MDQTRLYRIVGNLINMVGSFWPSFLIFFLIMASLFNHSINKGVIYLLGLIFVWIIWSFLLILFRTLFSQNTNQSDESQSGYLLCQLSSLSFLFNIIKEIPILGSSLEGIQEGASSLLFLAPYSTPLVWFTNFYLFFILLSESPGLNVFIVALLLLGSITNIVSTYGINQCFRNYDYRNFLFNIAIGIIIGGGLGFVWYTIIKETDPNNLFSNILYQNEALCSLKNGKENNEAGIFNLVDYSCEVFHGDDLTVRS